MIKDRIQKEKVLEFAVAKRWFPFPEVAVTTLEPVAGKIHPITDIDVMISVPDDLSGYRTLLVDCKTKRKESSIGRALWLRGLMEYIGADRGLCILRSGSSIAQNHRYSASRLRVTLISENELAGFFGALKTPISQTNSLVAKMENWESFYGIVKTKPILSKGIDYIRSSYWMIPSSAEACRKTIGVARELHGEFNPEDLEHRAVVTVLASLFLHSLARVVNSLFVDHLKPVDADYLSRALLTMLYGNQGTYDLLNKLRQSIIKTNVSLQDKGELALPEWSRFMELVRQMLDSPLDASRAPLFLIELAFMTLSNSASISFLQRLYSEFPQAAKFALLGAEYLCKAASLPKEMIDLITNPLIQIQDPKCAT